MAELDELSRLRQVASAHLDDQARRAAWYQGYYDNEQGIVALLDTAERETFRTFLAIANANWCELITNAVAERLQVTGFRFGGAAASSAAWAIWQANSMDADAELVQTAALVAGNAFVLVQADDGPAGVSISPESPLQATVVYEPGSRRQRLCGYKRFIEPGETSATEYLITDEAIVTWLPRDRNRPIVEPNPSGVIGMIEVAPQPGLLGGHPRSELVSATSFQDRINSTIFNRLVSADYGAFRQLWATGVKIAREVIRTDEGGQVTKVAKPFQIGADRLLTNENPEGRFGAFPEGTLRGYLDSVEQDVTMLAAATQTPTHYLTGQLTNLSADAIRAAEAGLVAKVRRRALHIGEAWEEVMRTAFHLVGDAAATNLEAEVIWADFETRSEGQRVDALVKMATLGVPRTVLWEKWGATSSEVARWQQLAATEQTGAPAA